MYYLIESIGNSAIAYSYIEAQKIAKEFRKSHNRIKVYLVSNNNAVLEIKL